MAGRVLVHTVCGFKLEASVWNTCVAQIAPRATDGHHTCVCVCVCALQNHVWFPAAAYRVPVEGEYDFWKHNTHE